MQKISHTLVGVFSGVAVAAWYPTYAQAAWIGLGLFAGCNAPDWLEVSSYKHGVGRVSLIPHRTLTHWLPAWMVIAAVLVYITQQQLIWFVTLTLGFVLGGILHLLTDLPNPTGVPILTPFKRSRVSLNWWKSGSFGDVVTVLVVMTAAGYSCAAQWPKWQPLLSRYLPL